MMKDNLNELLNIINDTQDFNKKYDSSIALASQTTNAAGDVTAASPYIITLANNINNQINRKLVSSKEDLKQMLNRVTVQGTLMDNSLENKVDKKGRKYYTHGEQHQPPSDAHMILLLLRPKCNYA